MSEWKEYKLGEVVKLIGGGTPNTTNSNYWGGDIPWLSVGDFNKGRKYVYDAEKHITQEGLNNSSTKILHKEDIIISARGTVGVVAMIGREMAFNQSCYGVRGKELIDQQYLYYLLIHSVQGLKQNAYGGVFDTITRETFDLIDISLPPIEEQKRIAGVLSSLDDKIDLLNQENATLEALAETLFRHYFIENPNPTWKEGTIDDVIEINPARRLSKGENAPYLEMANINTQGCAPLNWYNRPFSSGSKYINGDALMARITPCLENGKAAYIDFLGNGQVGWGSTEFIVLRTRIGLHPFFAYVLTRYSDFRDHAISSLVGSSGRQRVDIDNLRKYPISIPDEKTIKIFNHDIDNIVPKIKNNNHEILTLIQMRDGLLPKLMSNEITI